MLKGGAENKKQGWKENSGRRSDRRRERGREGGQERRRCEWMRGGRCRFGQLAL